jgi:hypothetical protein
MADKRPQREAPQPSFEDVLRRMLNTRPDPHVKPAKKSPKRRKK